MGESKNDGPFEAVLHNTGNIDLFLDEFFSFLARRTDFFVVSPPEGGNIGFPPGVAAKLIASKFKKWGEFANERRGTPKHVVPEAIESVDIETTYDDKGAGAAPKTRKIIPSEKKKTTTPTPTPTSFKVDNKQPNPSDSWNGKNTDKYSWSQSIKDLDVHVFVGKEVKSKRDLEVKILGDRIKVLVPSLPEPVVADWKLPHPIIKDESYWSLHPGESVFFTLQKVQERWWDHAFEGEEAIDRTKIEAVRPMEDLGEEEQAKINELMYNQEQKLKGLPTSDQTKLENIMKQAWDAEGSPFKGEPFDPSRVQLASNSMNQ